MARIATIVKSHGRVQFPKGPAGFSGGSLPSFIRTYASDYFVLKDLKDYVQENVARG